MLWFPGARRGAAAMSSRWLRWGAAGLVGVFLINQDASACRLASNLRTILFDAVPPGTRGDAVARVTVIELLNPDPIPAGVAFARRQTQLGSIMTGTQRPL